MTKSELISNLADLEWEDFEVKAAKDGLPKSSWETVSAFSNTTGGWLVFGVKQSGKSFIIQGLSNPEKTEQDFLNAIRSGKFNVFIPTQQMKYEIESKKVIAFYIPVSSNKPVYFNTLSNTDIRRGSSDQKATKEEIDAMFRDQTFGTKTSELVSGTSHRDIDLQSLKQYREYMSRFNPDVSYNLLDGDEFLSKLRISDPQSDQLTYAGLLFLGKRTSIEKHFPDFRIDLLEIPGTSYSDASSRYTFRLNVDDYENLWQAYFECYNRLRKEVKVAYQVSDEGFGEEISPGLKSLREALVNMLMHADYFSPAHPRIRNFEDRIEFYNPGGLPKPLQELKQKDLSIPRNPILAKLFRMVRIAENAGYGFDKMESNWKKYNGSEVNYIISFDSTIVAFPLVLEKVKKTIDDGLDADQIKYGNDSEKLRIDFEEASDKLSELISVDPIPADELIRILGDHAHLFLQHLDHNFRKASEKLRKSFGIASEELEGHFKKISQKNQSSNDRLIFLLILIVIEPGITALRASEILGVSSRTVENYFNNLKQEDVIERIGGRKEGRWVIKKK